jgi:NO-binding membrane sensor protein with MHYT domain
MWPTFLALLALALLAAAFMLEMDFVMMLGFPDGATTEYDVAMSNAVWAFDRFTVAVAIWLAALSFWSRRRNVIRAFLMTVAVYAVAVVALDHYYAAALPGPWGG